MAADHDPAAGGPDGEAPGANDHDRRRLRSARRLAIGGALLGVVVAAGVGVAGGTGGFGLVVVLLGLLVGCVLSAAHLAGFALADELRKLPVATRRPVEALGFFLVALLLILLVMGAAGALGDATDVADAAAGAATGAAAGT